MGESKLDGKGQLSDNTAEKARSKVWRESSLLYYVLLVRCKLSLVVPFFLGVLSKARKPNIA